MESRPLVVGVRVLVACEFSGRVREAFAANGHEAVSCDLLPTTLPGQHIQGDVRDILGDGWDMMVAFPPCEHLASSGSAWWTLKRSSGQQRAAIEFFMTLANAPIGRVCVENPKGIMTRAWRAPDQAIEPYMFGEPFVKATFLWLRGLPPLQASNVVVPTARWIGGDSTGGYGLHRNPTLRSLTFQGIADAMGAQWGQLGPIAPGDRYLQGALDL